MHLATVNDRMNDDIAQALLHHAPAQQYPMTHRAFEYASLTRLNPYFLPNYCGIQIEKPEPLPVDIEQFRKKKATVIGVISKFLSASASVFTPATDKLTLGGDLAAPPPPARLREAAETLCQSHAFDRGDKKQIAWMKEQRLCVLDRTLTPFYSPVPGPLIEVDSASSEHIQAADIAAGIAEITQIKLSVHTRNAPARRLYVSSGFETYGIERNVIRIGEESFDEELMMMPLR